MAAAVTEYGGYPAALIDVIVREAERIGLPPLLLLALGLGESSLDPEAVGDNGQSFGVFQIHVPVHGGPPGRWTGIPGTKAAMELMAPRWRNAWATSGGSDKWGRDASLFLWLFWPVAQGAIQASLMRCREVMANARPVWAAYQAAHAQPEPEPEPAPEPHVCPALSPEWLLRVGLAEQLGAAQRVLLLGVIPAPDALGSVRTAALEVARLVDAAGSGPHD